MSIPIILVLCTGTKMVHATCRKSSSKTMTWVVEEKKEKSSTSTTYHMTEYGLNTDWIRNRHRNRKESFSLSPKESQIDAFEVERTLVGWLELTLIGSRYLEHSVAKSVVRPPVPIQIHTMYIYISIHILTYSYISIHIHTYPYRGLTWPYRSGHPDIRASGLQVKAVPTERNGEESDPENRMSHVWDLYLYVCLYLYRNFVNADFCILGSWRIK